MVEIDPITGLPIGDEMSSQETHSTAPLRPQSPLVRGTHLDKSIDRSKKRPNITSQVDNEQFQQPARRGELQGFIPPSHHVTHPREKMQHIVEIIQTVMEGKEELVTDEDLLASQPLNMETTRFTMSKKKLKLGFIDDILDRFEDDRWLFPDQFERRRKLWHKSVARSVKYIDKFLEKEAAKGDYVPPANGNTSFGGSIASGFSATTARTGRGRPPGKSVKSVKPAVVEPPKARGRKPKDKKADDGAATVAKLTLPSPAAKIPKKAAATTAAAPKTAVKKPTFERKKKNADEKKETVEPKKEKKTRGKKKGNDDGDDETEGEPVVKKKRNEKKEEEKGEKETPKETATAKKEKAPPATKAKKPTFGAPKKGKKAAVVEEEAEKEKEKEVAMECDPPQETPVQPDPEPVEKEPQPVMLQTTPSRPPSIRGSSQPRVLSRPQTPSSSQRMSSQSGGMDGKSEREKRMAEYDKIDEDEEGGEAYRPASQRSQRTASQMRSQKSNQELDVSVIPPIDEGMESDDEEWEPSEVPKERTPPRGLISNHDPILPSSTPTASISSSQSLFGSLNNSLMDTSFSSQSSLIAPSPSLNLSFSSLIPSAPLATSTQIPKSPKIEKKKSEKKEEPKKEAASGPRVRPTFGKRK